MFFIDHINHIAFVILVMALFVFIGRIWNSFLKAALSEQTGQPSHKRLIGFLFAVVSLIVVLYAVMFGVAIADNIMWLLSSLVLGAMGLTATVDIFKNKNTPTPKDPEA